MRSLDCKDLTSSDISNKNISHKNKIIVKENNTKDLTWIGRANIIGYGSQRNASDFGSFKNIRRLVKDVLLVQL